MILSEAMLLPNVCLSLTAEVKIERIKRFELPLYAPKRTFAGDAFSRPASTEKTLDQNMPIPTTLPAIERETEKLGFSMASEWETGSLLRALAASKPGGEYWNMELGPAYPDAGC